MQTQVNLAKYTNSAGWEVIHDGETLLYIIKNSKGGKMHGSFTSRIFAEQHLQIYFEELIEASALALKAQEARKEAAKVQRATSKTSKKNKPAPEAIEPQVPEEDEQAA